MEENFEILSILSILQTDKRVHPLKNSCMDGLKYRNTAERTNQN